MANLTADQMQQVFKARPDVEASVAASGGNAIKGTTNWWNKFGKSELGASFFGSSPAVSAYSAQNITAAATAPAPRPDDLMNIRSSINNELGIPQLQTDYNNLFKQYSDYNTSALQRTNAYDQETDTGQLGIMNQQKTMGVLRGEAATQSAQRALGQSALAREVQSGSESLKGQLDVLANKLNMSTTEASERYNIRANEVGDVKNLMLQFPDAGIGFGDSTETMAGKIKTSNEKKTVTDMFTQTFGYFPEGLSMDKMNKELAKKYKSEKAYSSAKAALELQNIQSTIDSRTASANKSITDEAAKKDKENQDKEEKAQKQASADIDARSKFMDNIVQTYISKYNSERRQSKKDAIKAEARQKIEAQYPGWGWVSEKIG
jgi:hypothetical protein